MSKRQDPAKGIIAVAVGLDAGRKKIVLLNTARTPLVMTWEWPTLEEAEIFADGVQYALRSTDLDAVRLYRQGKLKLEVQRVSGASSEEEAALFRDGVMAGIDLLSQGYWLSDDDDAVHVLH